MNWTDVPLRDALNRISESQRLGIFLDRRADPGQIITLELNNVSVAQALHLTLEQCGLAGYWLEDIYYVGQPEHVAMLVANRYQAAREAAGLPRRDRRDWSATVDCRWDRLARPDDVMRTSILSDDQARVAAELPHDLWPAFGGPPLSRLDCIVLIANGFGRAIAFDRQAGGALRFPDAAVLDLNEHLEIALDVPEVRTISSRDLLAQLRGQFPGCQIELVSGSIRARATALEIVRMQEAIERQTLTADENESESEGTRVVSLRSRASIGQIMATAARGLGVELEYAPDLRRQLETRIEIDEERVTWPQLIEAALRDTDLTYQLDDEKLKILRKQR